MVSSYSTDQNRLLRFFAYGSVVSTYILILLGGYVTTSNSGLGCGEAWPWCQFQTLTAPVIIELSHRLFNFVVAVFVLGTLVLAWTKYRKARNVVLFSTVAFLGLIAQVILGMITVKTDLDPVVSDAHLGLASAILGVIIVNAVMVWNLRSRALELGQ